MAEIINLRLARKAKARTQAETKAEQNRAKFGQTKADKLARKAEMARASKQHGAGKIEPADNGPAMKNMRPLKPAIDTD